MVASVSTSIPVRLRSRASFRPSRMAQSSASILDEWPMLWQKPEIHLPVQSLMIPPAAASPGLFFEAPSVLSLKRLGLGGSQEIADGVVGRGCLDGERCCHSMADAMANEGLSK